MSRQRNRLVCQLHAVLCDLIPGGFAKEITAGQAAIVIDKIEPHGTAGTARLELARDLLAGIRSVDEHRRQVKKRLARLVAASKTTVTDVYGVGPVVAATVLGYVGDVRRFQSRITSPRTTRPHRSRRPPATGTCIGYRYAGIGSSTTLSTWPP